MMKKTLSLISLALLCGCVTPSKESKEIKVDAPKGFAVQDETLDDEEIMRAVSYTGVTYRVRKIPNEQKANLAFWRESFEKHLTDSGYLFQKRTRVKKSGAKAVHVSFIAPTYSADYRYSFSMVVNDDWIVVAEAAGLADDYDPVAKSIQRAARNIHM